MGPGGGLPQYRAGGFGRGVRGALCRDVHRRREGRAGLQGLQGLRRRAGRNGVSGYGLRQRDGAGRDACLPALLECRHERLDLEQQGARRHRCRVQRDVCQRLFGAAPAFFAAGREPVAPGLPDGRLHEPVAVHDMARRRRKHGFARRGSAQAESGLRAAGHVPPGRELFLLSRLPSDLQAGRRMDFAFRHLPHGQPAGVVERL